MKDFKKNFLTFKNSIWQFSFLLILIPFIYLNQINEMPLMQKQNFNEHIYLYTMSLMKLVDNGANLVKYFYVVFFSALVVISFYFKKNTVSKVSFELINIYILIYFTVYYGFYNLKINLPSIFFTITFLVILFVIKKKKFLVNYLNWISIILVFCFLIYSIYLFEYIYLPKSQNFDIYEIDSHFSSLLLQNYRIIDGVDIFDDPGKAFQFSYGFLKDFYFIFLQYFSNLNFEFVLLFLKVLQVFFTFFIIYLSYLRYKKIYLIIFFLIISLFYNPNTYFLWLMNHTSFRYFFLILSLIIIWFLLKKIELRHSYIYSIISFIGTLYNFELGIILFFSLSGLYIFGNTNLKNKIVYFFTYFFLILISLILPINFEYFNFLLLWIDNDKGKIGGLNYQIYFPFIFMYLHSLICLCRNVSYKLKSSIIKFDFIIASIFIGFGSYFVFRSALEYFSFLFVIYSFIFLRLSSDLRWFFNKKLKYFRYLILVIFFYGFSYHLSWTLNYINFKMELVNYNKTVENNKTLTNIKDSCSFLKNRKDEIPFYITGFAFFTRSICDTKNLLKTKNVFNKLIYDDEYDNFINNYLPNEFILFKLDQFSTKPNKHFVNLYKDFIKKVEKKKYYKHEESPFWITYKKPDQNK